MADNSLEGRLRARFGPEIAYMAAAPGEQRLDVPVVSTMCAALDHATGIGGLPYGRIVEIFGPPMAGKTTLSLHVAASAQRDHAEVVFVDAEHGLDLNYAAALGCDLSRLLVSQPDYGEQAIDVVDCSVDGGADVVVVDSVAALTPKAELDGDFVDEEGKTGKGGMALHARLMSQAMRRLCAKASKHKCLILFLNQTRDNLGKYGGPKTTTGGHALRFYSSVRLKVQKISPITAGNDTIGSRTRVTVVKNKLSSPFRKAEFDIMFGKGVSSESSLLEQALDLGVITRAGSYYDFGEQRLAQGKVRVMDLLLANPDLAAVIEAAVKEQMG